MLFTKNKIKKISLLSVLIFLLVFSVQAFAMPDMVSVNIPNIRQIKSNWCWCASSVALLSSKNISATQNSFSIATKGNSTNDQGASADEVQYGLRQFGYNATQKSGSMYSSSVRNTLNSSKGIIAGYRYNYYGGGHMVVISGHKKSDNSLEVMDPGVGRKEYYNFNYFVSNSNWEWDVSLY
ncbi:papain-like cysteine protease family protein [Clostridiaceae bacterium M8S5]|nr:papain-like cysteine protease family protein [Clostridiaceae bacterium M8S5]